MTLRSLLHASIAATALLAAAPALAEVTADDVWQSWVDYYTAFGSVVTGNPTRAGDTLTVSGATLTTATGDGTVSASLGDVRLRELGDGRVEMTLPQSVPIVMTSRPETGETVEMRMHFNHVGMTTIVSGDPGAMTHEMAAPEIAFGMDSMTVDGTPIELNVDITMKGNRGNSEASTANGYAGVSDFASDLVSFSISAKDPEGSGSVSMSGESQAIQGGATVNMPAGVDIEDMAAALRAGFSVTLNGQHGGGNFLMDFVDDEGPVQISSNGGSGTFEMAFGPDGLAYGATSASSEMFVSGPMIPFPLSASVGEMAMRLAMPLMASAEPGAFEMVLKLVDFSVSDDIWSMLDPTAQLPHDPATVIVDVSGQARLTMDLVDPAIADSAAPPGELLALDINEVRLTAAGAEASGAGGFTFDNSDMSMGYPKPLGGIDLKLTGGNALLDKLVAMGILPDDQAMGARMFMGMFGVPAGDDALTSRIEFREDGGLYANGQRLQ